MQVVKPAAIQELRQRCMYGEPSQGELMTAVRAESSLKRYRKVNPKHSITTSSRGFPVFGARLMEYSPLGATLSRFQQHKQSGRPHMSASIGSVGGAVQAQTSTAAASKLLAALSAEKPHKHHQPPPPTTQSVPSSAQAVPSSAPTTTSSATLAAVALLGLGGSK
jgi:hypothetical protein